MAEIHPPEKKLSSSSFNLFNGGAVNGKVPGTTQTGKIDRFQGWSRLNGAQLDEPRINSFSREDAISYGTLYKQSLLDDNVSAGNGSTSRSTLRNSSKASTSSSGHVSATVDAPASVLASEARVLRSSGNGVPPLSRGSPSPSRPVNSANVNARDQNNETSPGLGVRGRSSFTDDSFNKEPRGTHRRLMSDVGSVTVDSLYNGEPRRNVSGQMSSSESSTGGYTPRVGSDTSPYWSWSDSGRFSSKDGSSWSTSSSGGSPSVLNLKVSSNPVADSPSPRASTSSSGGSSRGSSVVGSPTVSRTSSVGNLNSKSTGLAPSEVSSTISSASRTRSCNIANLRGNSYTVGALPISGKSASTFDVCDVLSYLIPDPIAGMIVKKTLNSAFVSKFCNPFLLCDSVL